MLKYANPTLFSGLVARSLPWLAGATALAFAIGLWGAFFASPADYQQGDTVRIMYIHVPAAWLSMFVLRGHGGRARSARWSGAIRWPTSAPEGGRAARRRLHLPLRSSPARSGASRCGAPGGCGMRG